MGENGSHRRFRFGVFEADEETGELRKQGMRVRIGAQAFQTLMILLESPGQLVSRETISQRLWPDGTFVDFEHGVNSAVNRIREALGDSAAQPRYVETLARRGYRFLMPVEAVSGGQAQPVPEVAVVEEARAEETPRQGFGVLAAEHELPEAPHRVVRTLLLLLQLMYLSFYIGALANLPEVGQLLAALPYPQAMMVVLIVTAAILLPVRLFLLMALLFRAPSLKAKFLRLFPGLLPLDELWSLSPFLLLHHIDFGLALGATAVLVYAPFAQRSLVLMMDRHAK